MDSNLFYLIEIIKEGEAYYVFNKRILLHNPDLAKKFKSFKSAYNYYKFSENFKTDNKCRIVKYDKNTNEVIYK